MLLDISNIISSKGVVVPFSIDFKLIFCINKKTFFKLLTLYLLRFKNQNLIMNFKLLYPLNRKLNKLIFLALIIKYLNLNLLLFSNTQQILLKTSMNLHYF